MYVKYYECWTVHDAEKQAVFLLTERNKSNLKEYYKTILGENTNKPE